MLSNLSLQILFLFTEEKGTSLLLLLRLGMSKLTWTSLKSPSCLIGDEAAIKIIVSALLSTCDVIFLCVWVAMTDCLFFMFTNLTFSVQRHHRIRKSPNRSHEEMRTSARSCKIFERTVRSTTLKLVVNILHL